MFKSIFTVATAMVGLIGGLNAQTVAAVQPLETTIKTSQKYRFPVIQLAQNAGVAAEINEEIIIDLTNHLDYLNIPFSDFSNVQTVLDNLATFAKTGSTETLTSLNYQVLYNKNSLLSLKFTMINDNNHANDLEIYYNFDLRSGARLTLADVIEPTQMPALLEHFKENVTIRNSQVIEKISANPNYRNSPLTKELVRKCLAEVNQAQIRDFAFTNEGVRICANYKPFVDILKAKPQDDFLYQYSFVRYFLKSDLVAALKLG